MSVTCKQCGATFKTIKGLHSHLRVHGGQEVYYHTHHPRLDLYDGSVIKFKNKDKYFSTFFNSSENREAYYSSAPVSESRKVYLEEFLAHAKHKNIDFIPCHNYFKFTNLSGVNVIKKIFESCACFADQSNLKQIYTEKLPKNFWDVDERLDEMTVFVDTREQKPFKFKNNIINKLDFGDYVASGNYFNKTYVDRKSLEDFKGTFGKGYERFKQEVERAKQFDSYLFVVVEASIKQIEQENESSKHPSKLNYIFHNLRDFLLSYPDISQIVFCDSREEANDITKRILFNGPILWDCDFQYFLDQRHGLE